MIKFYSLHKIMQQVVVDSKATTIIGEAAVAASSW
jgi:hypothetical protein